MCPCCPLRRASSRSRPLLVILTLVVRTSTTAWLITSLRSSSARPRRTSATTSVPCAVSVLLASVRSVLCPAPPRLTSRLTHCTTVSTTTWASLVPSSRIFAWTTSASAWNLLRRCYVTPSYPRVRCTRLCWLVAPLVFLRCRSSSASTSTARSSTSPSTLMRLWLTVLLSRPLSSAVPTSPRSCRTFCCSMSLPCHSVSRPLVV